MDDFETSFDDDFDDESFRAIYGEPYVPSYNSNYARRSKSIGEFILSVVFIIIAVLIILTGFLFIFFIPPLGALLLAIGGTLWEKLF